MTNSEPTAEPSTGKKSQTSASDAQPADQVDNDFEADNAIDDEEVSAATEASAAPEDEGFGSDEAAEDVTLSAKEYHELTEERDEYKDKFIRKVAELDNLIRRTAKEKSDLAKFGNEGFIKELLPVLDSFDQALPDDGKAPDDATKDFAAGMQLVKKKLLDVFAKNGVEVVDDKGKPFDPNLHQAIQKVEDPAVQEEIIAEQYQKGYTLNGRLVRPAMVVVAVPAAKPADD